MCQVWQRDRHFGPIGSSVCGRGDRVGVFDAHRWPDHREVVGAGHACELVRRGKDRLCGHDVRPGWYPQLSDQVPEAGVVVHEQDARFTITDYTEGVRHTARHRYPVPGSHYQHVVAAAHHHLAVEDVPGIIKGVVHVQRRRGADRQGHLEHDRLHARGATVLDDEEVEEPPCLGLFVLGTVNDCYTHGKASFFDWVAQQGLAPPLKSGTEVDLTETLFQRSSNKML